MHPCVFCDPATLPWGLRGVSAWARQAKGCSEKLEEAKSVCSWMQYMPKKFRPKRSCWVSSDAWLGFPWGDLWQSKEVSDYYNVKVWQKEHLLSLKKFNQSKFFPSARLCLAWNQWLPPHSTSPFPTERKRQQLLPYFQEKFHLSWQGIWKAYDSKLSTLQCFFYSAVRIGWIT